MRPRWLTARSNDLLGCNAARQFIVAQHTGKWLVTKPDISNLWTGSVVKLLNEGLDIIASFVSMVLGDELRKLGLRTFRLPLV